MNNKGFAISTILYTILICFMLFLGAAMAMFSAANDLSSSANDDLINGSDFTASSVVVNNDKDEPISNISIKISNKSGIAYWPRDFGNNGSGSYKNITAVKNDNTVTFRDTITDEVISCTKNESFYSCE